MASSSELNLRLDVVFHDPFPRSAYVALCAVDGRAFTEDDYVRWRDMCERLSGDMSTERRIEKLADNMREAFSKLGVTTAQASSAIGALGVALSQVGLAKDGDDL